MIVGGGSLIDGISQRLTFELTEMLPSAFKVPFGLFIYCMYVCMYVCTVPHMSTIAMDLCICHHFENMN